MPYDHVIAAGDHIVRLAYLQGMRDPMLIWNDGQNSALRAKRADPGVLAVGDVVHVPDGPAWVFEGLATGRDHTVVVDLAVPWVRIRLRHPGGLPRAGKPCDVVVDGERKRFETDSDGLVEVEVGPFTASIDVEIDEERYRLLLARLDPPETLAGVRQRLFNLGYDPGSLTGKADDYFLRMAVEEFQRDHGLEMDGVPGGNTQKKLAEVHGA
jgi:N-acetylmuramoyl-L-alanine amidase